MQWFRAHPYLAALLGAMLLILIGALLVGQRAPVRPGESTSRTWGVIGANLLDPTATFSPGKIQQPESLYTAVKSGPPFYYGPPTPVQIPSTNTSDTFDFDAFLAMLSHPPQKGAEPLELSSLYEAYSFIPSGLISTSSKARTPNQQALYNYGNEAGSSIETYERAYRNAPQILKDQFEDRENPAKREALKDVAAGLSRVGRALAEIENVPPEAAAANTRLAASYKEMGEKLALVADARRDEDVLEQILSYNGTVDTYLKNYAALATILATAGVTFGNEDPGRVFVFTSTTF